MSTWRHAWEGPYVAIVLVEDGEEIHTARQQCSRCRCERNPISGGIAEWGYGNECKDHPDTVDHDWSAQLEYVKEQLTHLKADGRRVETYHTGRERARR